jgi:hypothetical protein
MVWAPRDPDNVITDPKQALDVFDFEPAVKKNLPPAHFGYMVTGADDEVTLRANREGFLKFQLRPRRLVDVSTIDMTTELFGARYDSPIVIAPTGGNLGGQLSVGESYELARVPTAYRPALLAAYQEGKGRSAVRKLARQLCPEARGPVPVY